MTGTERPQIENVIVTINSLCEVAHRTAVEKRWWDSPRSFPECIALMHSELSEALEAFRHSNLENMYEEMSDVLIRIFDYCGYLDKETETSFTLGDALIKKMEKNLTRPYRHGGLKA